MMTSLWLIGLMSLLVVGMRTGAQQQQQELVPHRCYFCAHNETSCEAPGSVECPADRPLCATSVVAPNFTSSLGCAAAAKAPCSMTETSGKSFALTCVCMENLCNAPFTTEMQKQLFNFTSSNFTNNSADYVKVFFEFANITGDDVYKTITIPVQAKSQMNSSLPSTVASSTISVQPTVAHPVEIVLPRAEALKHDASEPSDDDEDESEGSGAYEDTRSQPQPASAPANPSSYLPAEKNKSPNSFTNFLVATPVLMYFIA